MNNFDLGISVRNIFFTKASVGNATWLDLGMYIN